MKSSPQRDKSAGFALVETVLVLVILAAIVGVGLYVARQKSNVSSTLNSSGGSSAVKAPAGTTAGINQLTQQDAQTEAGIDSSADGGTQQTSTSANGAVNNVGGAYNEANY